MPAKIIRKFLELSEFILNGFAIAYIVMQYTPYKNILQNVKHCIATATVKNLQNYWIKIELKCFAQNAKSKL